MDSKKFIQYAWVIETVIIILMTIVYVHFIEIIPFWIQALPLLTTLIGAQGMAASIGPAIIKSIEIKHKEESSQ